MAFGNIQVVPPSVQGLRPIPIQVKGPQANAIIPQKELSQLKPIAPKTDGPELLPINLNTTRPTESGESPLRSFIHAVDQKSKVAGGKVAAMMAGEDVSLGETMVSIQESKISFQLMVEVRNKLLEAYQELMRMQV